MFEPNELEHTSSARSEEVCAPVFMNGRISYKETGISCWAACQAASLPANPPPITINLFDIPNMFHEPNKHKKESANERF
jgi:hypothetical protein